MLFLTEWKKFNLGCQDKVLLAVSTGVDSMSLVDLMQHLPLKWRPQIQIAYVDHQLRQQSALETQFIQEYCCKHHLKLHSKTWKKEMHPQTGIEEQARNFRYQFFQDVMQKEKIKYVITAHHADDQAETFLMKLVRGGQLQQLVGIEPKRLLFPGHYVLRPLLNFSKAELEDYAVKHQLQFFQDETNFDDDVLRNRIRHQVIPKLKAENPQFLKHIQAYQTQLKMTLENQQELVRMKLNQLKTTDGWNLEKFNQLAIAQRKAILKQILMQKKLPVNENQCTEMLQFLANQQKPQQEYKINFQKRLRKEYQTFKIVNETNVQNVEKDSVALKLNQWTFVKNYQIGIFAADKYQVTADDLWIGLASLPAKLCVRHRLPHDIMETKIGHKKIRRIFIDQKFTNQQRQAALLVATHHEILAILTNQQIYLSHFNENATIRYIMVIKYRKR